MASYSLHVDQMANRRRKVLGCQSVIRSDWIITKQMASSYVQSSALQKSLLVFFVANKIGLNQCDSAEWDPNLKRTTNYEQRAPTQKGPPILFLLNCVLVQSPINGPQSIPGIVSWLGSAQNTEGTTNALDIHHLHLLFAHCIDFCYGNCCCCRTRPHTGEEWQQAGSSG